LGSRPPTRPPLGARQAHLYRLATAMPKNDLRHEMKKVVTLRVSKRTYQREA
jgi:hypothetical protein